MASLYWLLIDVLLGCAVAEQQIVDFEDCGALVGGCDVNEVRIEPCNKNKQCIFNKGSHASISFDFVPYFSASELSSALYWMNGASEVEFDEMKGIDACTLTKCPTEAGKTQNLDYILHVGSKTPKGNYTFKWKLWNTHQQSQSCCFKTTVQIRK